MNEAGKLKNRITIQRPTRARDEGGGFVDTWVDLVTLWASVRPLTASPLLSALQPQQQITHEVKIRHASGVLAQISKRNRIVYKGRMLEISDIVNEDEAGKFFLITCIENGV